MQASASASVLPGWRTAFVVEAEPGTFDAWGVVADARVELLGDYWTGTPLATPS